MATPYIVMMGVLGFHVIQHVSWKTNPDRIYMDVRTLAVFMFAPFVTILVAPI